MLLCLRRRAARKMTMFRFALLLALVFALPAQALPPVDLELVLAVDISRSVDDEEGKLQREGYIAALTNPRVIEAIQSGPMGQIAVAYVEWAGSEYQRTAIDWFLIQDGESAGEFVSKIAALPRVSMGWTSISGAIDHSARLFGKSYEGMRRVIDVSGDGVNNSGRPVWPNFGRPAEANLDRYYEDYVIGGPGSFMIAAEDFNVFGRAVLAKLIREIAELPRH
jgi:hypothetical protein